MVDIDQMFNVFNKKNRTDVGLQNSEVFEVIKTNSEGKNQERKIQFAADGVRNVKGSSTQWFIPAEQVLDLVPRDTATHSFDLLFSETYDLEAQTPEQLASILNVYAKFDLDKIGYDSFNALRGVQTSQDSVPVSTEAFPCEKPVVDSMSLKPGELLDYVVFLLKGFDPSVETIEAYAEQYYEQHPIDDDDDDEFIQSVIAGCTRYKRLLDVIVSNFLETSTTSLKSDSSLYTVVTYLALMAIDQLGFSNFKMFVNSQRPAKMATLLQYLWNWDNFENNIKIELCKLYEPEFVENLKVRMKLHEQEILNLIEKLTGKVSGTSGLTGVERGMGATGRSTRVTVVQPFNLTSPKPRAVQPPKAYKTTFTASPVPESHYTKPDNTMRTKKTSKESTLEVKPFDLATDRRPSNLSRVAEEVEKKRQKELQFNKKVARPMPTYPPTAPVRLTVAAVLREEKALRRKQEEEARILQQFEQDLRDSREFERWRSKQQAEEEAQRAVQIEQTKEEIAASAAEAQKAKMLSQVKKSVAAAELAGEMAELLLAKQEKEDEEAELIRKRAEEIAVEEKMNVDAAKKLLLEQRKDNAEKMAAERAERERQLAEQRAAEEEKRRDIIMQIRALERVPAGGEGGGGSEGKGGVKLFDPTTTPGHGLLDEMSLSELKEKLRLLQEREEKEREERRNAILATKAEKEAEMQSKVEFISRLRERAAADGRERKEKEQMQQRMKERLAQKQRDQSAEKMHDKLTAKREAKAREIEMLEAEARAIREKNKLLANDLAGREGRKFRDLQKGSERTAKIQLNQQKQSQAAAAAVKAHEERQRRLLNEKKQRQKEASINEMKRKYLSDKAVIEQEKAKLDEDRHTRTAVGRAMQRLSSVEAAEYDPTVAIDHILEAEDLGGF
ncbi:putative flagellar associated protein [Monocercomonoides exilis]|uniref:putative flagellar associated protein n=1 Tax=Monocercomonoides exilis TaxID=2049356 RepID=UPI003559FD1D|nr:putative flagellar associated protein [Monocercomonoides exilis]|eukprot:MONOS_13747.1-p1 / transcript=MONOS_13747.1 / gene=MONOS_13747 / organism=Monocercomonoides_exilis_PA203 / gene_product=flagellar associated protein / transcript_product=flagellar associated protein / location=Mono_scaffold00876:14526-18411(-) / protein_length=899 / sequence_SO=supercontig / SO=protein_coding / is_pseudo=false